MSVSHLFSEYPLGSVRLANRIVMAPMTRNRCEGNVPNALVERYYAQRAEAGLIISEGTSPSPHGLGYARIPGLFNAEHVAAWKKVTDAVHANGGRIFVQLMHTGRASHQDNLPAGARVLAPSAVALSAPVWVDGAGEQPPSTPEAMSADDIEATIEEYVQSSRLAIEAGFDGVELHGANGYLIDQFLNTASNQRTDAFGGSPENRMRFALETARRTAQAIGAERVGMRISPYGVFNDMCPDAEMDALYLGLAAELSKLDLAYLHLVDHSSMGAPQMPQELPQALRKAFKGTFILSGGYDGARAEEDLAHQRGDLVAFGRPFISNPRLPAKLRENKELTAPDFATFYTPGEQGYTDYPVEG